jgi:hypothetical protein
VTNRAEAHLSVVGRGGFGLAKVAAGDIDIAIVGNVSLAQLALRDTFEPHPVQVIRF